MPRVLIASAAVLGLLVAGCGDDEDGGDAGAAGGPETATEAPEAETATDPAGGEAAAKPGARIKLGDSQFGRILFDSNDQAIYLFEKEGGRPTSQCYGECAEEWPPVLTKGEPAAGRGINAGLLGTTKRDDGTTQATYNGHPLYYYNDEAPGEVRCHNVEGFGALWKVLDGAGNPLA